MVRGVEVVKTHKEFEAWQKGVSIVRAVYALVKQFPRVEQLDSLTS